MTFNNYLPPKTWAAIVKIADEYGLSTKEVERVILNKVLCDMGLMNCEHKRIGRAKSDGKPYCKDCWTRFKESREKEYNYETNKWAVVSRYIPVGTFLDELESKGKGQVQLEEREQFV